MRACLFLALFSSLGLLACGADSDSAKPADASVLLDAVPNIDAGGDPDAMPQVANLESLLADLRADRDGAMLRQSRAGGWPAAVENGYLVVSTEGLALVAGDHDKWAGTSMTQEDDFYWAVIDASAGSRYKFTDGNLDYRPDPWSRAYAYDNEGLMSMRAPSVAHLERHFAVGDVSNAIAERTIRVWLPMAPATHLLYVHDGQNLFDPGASFGGWQLNAVAPAGLAIVGIDNVGAERFAEYSHVDDFGETSKGDAYAAYVQDVVRPLIRSHYGEPEKLGTMGSSMGGLASLHLADRYPGQYDFAASLSGTLGWGSINGQGTDTIIARYAAAGLRGTALYIDSGGNGTTCVDSDGDGTNDDDETSRDNYCETRQLETTLVGLGYQYDIDLWHWHEPDAPHNEGAWGARVFRPLQNFMGL